MILFLMTTYRESRLHAFIDGPPRDNEYIAARSKYNFVNVDLPGLVAIDTSIYNCVCIFCSDFSTFDDDMTAQWIKWVGRCETTKIYYIQPKLAEETNSLPFDHKNHTTYISWSNASRRIDAWRRTHSIDFKKIKLIVAGMGIEGSRYASELFEAIDADGDIPGRLIIQSNVLFTKRSNQMYFRDPTKITIVLHHTEDAEPGLIAEYTSRIKRSHYKTAKVYIPSANIRCDVAFLRHLATNNLFESCGRKLEEVE
jgi:hypothetical protein